MCICILYPVSCMNCISYSVYNCILYHTITIATQCIPVSRIDCILFLYWHYKNCGQWWKSCHWRILFQTHILNIKQDGFTHIWKNVMIFFLLYCTVYSNALYCALYSIVLYLFIPSCSLQVQAGQSSSIGRYFFPCMYRSLQRYSAFTAI